MNKLIKQIIESKFNFNIDIEDNERHNSLSKSVNISKSLKQAYIDLYIVDLGLPSKTIWCKYNLGIDINLLNTAENWYGGYYAWGEVNTKTYYDWTDPNNATQNYKYANGLYDTLIKYCNNSEYGKDGFTDNLTTLVSEDDAAYIASNGIWRMPTKVDFEELIAGTYNSWVENYNDIPNLKGKLFKSKINDNEIFIPVAGYCYNSGLNNVGALLWSSSLNAVDPSYAWRLYFYSSKVYMGICSRCYGCSVRPVLYIN